MMLRFKPFSDGSIGDKMTRMILGISATGLLVFTVIFAVVELNVSRARLLDDLTILAESVAQNSTAAISFLDRQSATDLLKALSADADITAGAIIIADNSVFARYPDQVVIPAQTLNHLGSRFLFDKGTLLLELSHPIMLDGQTIANLYIRSNLAKSKQQGTYLLITLLLDFLMVLILVMLASRRLQSFITRPVTELADTMQSVTTQGTYTLQAKVESEDEIGQLVRSFNAMLAVICTRDKELHTQQENLELQVEKRTQELKQKHDEALQLAQAKSDFLAHMSHELRTPLNAIIGMSHLLKRTPLIQKQQAYLETLYTASDLLLGNINNVLDFSKLEAGKTKLANMPFQLSTLWLQLSSLFQTKATAKGLALQFPNTEAFTDTLLGDPAHLTQVLVNLLDNAIKFTDNGTITVQTEVLMRKQEKLLLRFAVRDSGIGLHSWQIDQLFQPFSQVSTRGYKQGVIGTGLGLAICKQLVTAMGGTINVSSQPEQGSLFSFTVRLATTTHLPTQNTVSIPEPADAATTSSLTEVHILLVEDTPANHFVIEELLRSYPVAVTAVETGIKALEIINQRPFDLVLMDIQMPGMDGCETTRRIRQHARYEALPIIAMTAHALSGDRERFLDAGMNDYLAKPFHPPQLQAILHKWLQLQPNAQENIMPTTDYRPIPRPSHRVFRLLQGFDYVQGLKSVGHDLELYQRTLQLFAEDYQSVDEKICLALKNNRRREAERLIHSLIGASALIGWIKLSQLACSLQDNLKDQELQLFNQQLQQIKMELKQTIPVFLKLDYTKSLDKTA